MCMRCVYIHTYTHTHVIHPYMWKNAYKTQTTYTCLGRDIVCVFVNVSMSMYMSICECVIVSVFIWYDLCVCVCLSVCGDGLCVEIYV